MVNWYLSEPERKMDAARRIEPERERPPSDDLDVLNREVEGLDAEALIAWAGRRFERLVMTSSFGARSALMLHLVSRVLPEIPVIVLDTGYLFPETYRFMEALRERFDLNLHVFTPKMTAARQEALYGYLWDQGEEELRRYQRINKVEPMQRALSELRADAWLAGLRAEQTAFRAGLRRVEKQNGIFKVHPILAWSDEEVRAYFEAHELPYHPLFPFGYRSIGDVHSTTPTAPDQDEREGRALGEKRECGIHLPDPDQAASLKSSGL